MLRVALICSRAARPAANSSRVAASRAAVPRVPLRRLASAHGAGHGDSHAPPAKILTVTERVEQALNEIEAKEGKKPFYNVKNPTQGYTDLVREAPELDLAKGTGRMPKISDFRALDKHFNSQLNSLDFSTDKPTIVEKAGYFDGLYSNLERTVISVQSVADNLLNKQRDALPEQVRSVATSPGTFANPLFFVEMMQHAVRQGSSDVVLAALRAFENSRKLSLETLADRRLMAKGELPSRMLGSQSMQKLVGWMTTAQMAVFESTKEIEEQIAEAKKLQEEFDHEEAVLAHTTIHDLLEANPEWIAEFNKVHTEHLWLEPDPYNPTQPEHHH